MKTRGHHYSWTARFRRGPTLTKAERRRYVAELYGYTPKDRRRRRIDARAAPDTRGLRVPYRQAASASSLRSRHFDRVNDPGLVPAPLPPRPPRRDRRRPSKPR